MRRYISKAERERAPWFTLDEAFTLVCAEYSFEDAEKLIRDLLAEEEEKKRIPRAWDEPPEPGRGPAYNLPPQGGKCWQGLEINFHSDCQVKDDIEWAAYYAAAAAERRRMPCPREPGWRTLLLHRATFMAAYEAIKRSGEKAAPQQGKKRGRSTRKPEILAAYKALKKAGEIDFEKPMTEVYPKIRHRITDSEEVSENLRDNAIWNAIRLLFKADKIASKSTSKPSRRSKSRL